MLGAEIEWIFSGGSVEGQWRVRGTPTMPQSLYTWAFPAILVEGGGLFA